MSKPIKQPYSVERVDYHSQSFEKQITWKVTIWWKGRTTRDYSFYVQPWLMADVVTILQICYRLWRLITQMCSWP